MPLNLPRTLQTLMTGDIATSRVISNVKAAVDPLLQLCNSTFQVANDGSLSFLRRIKSFTADTVNATTANVTNANVAGPLRANGDFFGAKRVIASNSGFKTYIPLGFYYNGSYALASGFVQTVQNTQNVQGTTYLMPLYVTMPFFGSVVGITALYYGQASSVTTTIQIRGINTTAQMTLVGAQPYANAVAFSRGAYSFTNAQNLQAFVSFNTAGNNLVYVGAIVEWDT